MTVPTVEHSTVVRCKNPQKRCSYVARVHPLPCQTISDAVVTDSERQITVTLAVKVRLDADDIAGLLLATKPDVTLCSGPAEKSDDAVDSVFLPCLC